jgi:hypothetical protein
LQNEELLRGFKEADFVEGQNVRRERNGSIAGSSRRSGSPAGRGYRSLIGQSSTFAGKAATATIPIVFIAGEDPVNGTFGVRSLVMQGEVPNPVPRGIVETMISSADDNDLLRFEQGLKVGAEVRLVAGPFAEQLGILDRLDDSGRIRVLLKIMGATIPVRVPRGYAIAA